MLNFNNLKLRDRILLGYAFPLFLTIAATSVVLINVKKVEEQSQAKENGWTIVRDTDRLDIAMSKRQRAIRGYLLKPDTDFLRDYDDNVQRFDELSQSLEKVIDLSGKVQAERLDQVVALSKQIDIINKDLISLVKAGKLPVAIKEFQNDKLTSLTQQLGQTLDELNAEEDKLQLTREKEVQAAMNSLTVAAIVGALSATILAVTIGLFIASRLSHTISSIVNIVASSSTEIAAAVQQQERSAAQQASAVSQTTTTMNELSASSRQSAQQAEVAAGGAQNVLVLVDGRNQMERDSRFAGSSLREKVGHIATQITRLSEQVSQIYNIANLVSNLANQTNMLALNAAVEAARAGEHGKGFAIVASEIRRLADQSRISAEKINTLVADIQNTNNSTVMVTDEGNKTVEDIVTAINDIALSSQQISLNAKQQAIAIQQVVDAMNILNASAQETASGISQTKVSTQKLNEAALDLKAVV